MVLSDRDLSGEVHIRFPGIFAKGWLYVNVKLVSIATRKICDGIRTTPCVGCRRDSVPRAPETNDITVRNWNNHHVSGMFRRPFLYRDAN